MDLYKHLKTQLQNLREEGLYKEERIITSAQKDIIRAEDKSVINLCANNYLGLSNDQNVIQAAKQSMDTYGFGLSSVRFICGTQSIHKALENKVSHFLGTEDTILYAAAFDANGGLFETLLGPEDVVISDALNHASIIDGIRLCKAQRLRYAHNDMVDLEAQLQKTNSARFRLIVTDGVFSMDGTIAQLDRIVTLAQKYNALAMVDDCHATGFIGQKGRGTHEEKNVWKKVDIITGTFGKALGGASGGLTSGKKELIAYLRQKSRPYLFSNSLAPTIAGASLYVLNKLEKSTTLKDKLMENTQFFRKEIQHAGFDIKTGTHPIVPIMLYDAKKAQKLAAKLMERGIYVIGFYYPVVPKNKARIRVQISAAHNKAQLSKAVEAFYSEAKYL